MPHQRIYTYGNRWLKDLILPIIREVQIISEYITKN